MKEEGIFGVGAGVAVVSALCCITPVVAMLGGISGVAATFSWVEPFRPYLIGLTVALLGFAWLQKLRPQNELDCACDGKPGFFKGKPFLGLITVFAVLMMAFPMYSGAFYGNNAQASGNPLNNTTGGEGQSGKYSKVVFSVGGMTCDSCERHVEGVVSELEGVAGIKASYKEGEAVITFDKNKTSEEEIRKTIDSTGYKAGNVVEAGESQKKYSKVVFAVGGMTCDSCERHVESTVNEIDGINDVKASYKDGKASVVFDGSKTSAREIRAAIDSTGYKVEKQENAN